MLPGRGGQSSLHGDPEMRVGKRGSNEKVSAYKAHQPAPRGTRGQSVCDDTSSELQRMAAIDRRDINSQNSLRGRGALSRIVGMVLTLRDWAHKGLHEEAERPDSFLERFRGPAHSDLQAPPSRVSYSNTGSEPEERRQKRRKACFEELQVEHVLVWLVLDYVCDGVYILDIAVRLHTGFLDQGLLVRDLSRFRQTYIRTVQCWLDLGSVLPTDLLYLWAGPDYTPLLRFNRLLRLTRLSELFECTETRTGYPNAFRICKLVLYILVLTHWNISYNCASDLIYSSRI